MGTTSLERAVIARIRRDRFLLDIEIPEEMAAGLTSIREDLDQALKLLSQNLYSTKTHFVLELVQNADDNSYAKGANPSLHFDLTPSALVVSNNETGFQEPNVEALCRTGKSSKARKAGYIGEKGIGFKSVFTVSDAPEIHSNGYHFRFDRTASGTLLGYVVPHWYEPTRPLDDSLTNIVIPARDGSPFEASVLADLEARLLLFLTKLKRLSFGTPERRVDLARADQGVLTKLSTTVSQHGQDALDSEYFVRVEHNLGIADLAEEMRPDVKQSQVVLALPVASDGKAKPDSESLGYAFLPIRTFGLKFCVQADFLLVANRGDILTDLDWNIRLRDSIAPAFVSGLPSFKKRQTLANSFLSFLPADADRIDPFFKPIVSQLRELLGQTECILTESGQWRKPSETMLPLQSFRALFTNQEVHKLFGLDYVKEDIDASTETLKSLGCKVLSYEQVFSVFRQHAAWFNRKSREWRAKYYGFLASLDQKGLLDNGILKVACIPTGDGSYIVPEQKSAFLPLSHDRVYGFEHELSIIDTKLYDKAIEINAKVAQLFEKLSVRPADSYQLIVGHILPKHANETWLESDNDAIVGHLRYVKENLESYLQGAESAGQDEGDALEALSNTLQIGTKDDGQEWTFNLADELYLSKEYEPPFAFEPLLGTAIEASSLVSPEYLKVQAESSDAPVEPDVAGWRTFLLKLGVREEPKLLQHSDGDFLCTPELTALLEHRLASVRRAVLECLDRRWHKYSNAVSYNRKEGRYNLVPTDTVFVSALRACIAPTRKTTKAMLSEAFLDTLELRDLFGEAAVYIEADLKSPGLIKACRITDRADAQACLKRLRQLKVSGTDTTPVLRRLYGQLHHLWDKEGPAIKAAFDSESLIRIRGERPAWLAPGQACWRSTSRLAELAYAPLAGLYGDLEAFFGKIGVARKLPLPRLVAAMPRLVEFNSLDDRLKEALFVYRACNAELNLRTGQETLEAPRWLAPLLNEVAFLTVDGRVVAKSERLYLDDMPEFGRLFHDQPGIDFFAVAGGEQSKLVKLLELLELQRLSDHIDVELVDEDAGELNQKFTTRLELAFEAIARVICHFDHDAFRNALHAGAFQSLANAQVLEVDELRLAVTLGSVTKDTTGEICLNGGNIVFRKGVKALADRIAAEVCKMLGVGRGHVDAITRLLICVDKEEMEDYLQVRDVPPLQQNEEDALYSAGLDLEADASDVDMAEGPEAQSVSAGNANDGIGDPVAATPPPPPQAQPTAAPVSPGTTSAPTPSAAGAQPPSATTASPVQPRTPSASPTGTFRSPVLGSGSVPRPPGNAGNRPVTPFAATGTSSGGSPALRPLSHTANGHPPTNGATAGTSGGHGGGSSPNGSGAPRPNPPPITNTRRGRLLSYADAPGQSPDGHEEDSEGSARDAIATAAVQAFLNSKNGRWKKLTEMPPNNPGFDIAGVAQDDADEFIEVKGQSGAWTEVGVALTPTELARAHQARSRYWLCVVEYALDPERRVVHLINDPFSRVTQFRFDSGWKSQVLSEEPLKPLEPDAGMRIEIANVGTGIIVSARAKGPFFKLQVRLDDGRPYERTFDPATMKLLPAEGTT